MSGFRRHKLEWELGLRLKIRIKIKIRIRIRIKMNRRVDRQGRLGVGAFEGGGEFHLEGSQRRGVGRAGIAQGVAGKPGIDFEGAGDLGQTHLFDFAVAEIFEEAVGGQEKFLGDSPFLLAIFIGPAGPVGGLPTTGGSFHFGLLLKHPRVEGVNALAPAIFAGPEFHGVMLLAQTISEGCQRAPAAKLEEGLEGAEGARGFARKAGEGWLRVHG